MSASRLSSKNFWWLTQVIQRRRRLIIFFLVTYILLNILICHTHKIPTKTTPRPPRKPIKSNLKKQNSSFIWNNIDLCHDPQSHGGNTTHKLVIIVHSARPHFLQRRLIRETWGSIKTKQNWAILSTVFMIGHQSDDTEDQKVVQELQEEQKKFGDIISGDFIDTYKNLALKAIMSYEWLHCHCPNVDMVIKVDDDVVINTKQLIRELNTWMKEKRAGNLNYYCHVLAHHHPIRNASHLLYVSKKEYVKKRWPSFCAGFAYVVEMGVIEKVLKTLKQIEHLIWLDDVFLTGIIRNKYNYLNKKRIKTEGGRINLVNTKSSFFWPDVHVADQQYSLFRVWINDEVDKDAMELLEEQFSKKSFYPLEHGQEFEGDFVHLWNKIL